MARPLTQCIELEMYPKYPKKEIPLLESDTCPGQCVSSLSVCRISKDNDVYPLSLFFLNLQSSFDRIYKKGQIMSSNRVQGVISVHIQ